MKQIELICISDKNNNKFYRMKESDNGFFNVEWGRVGYAGQTTTYSIDKWDSMYRAKLKKGYKDITHLKAEAKTADGSYIELTDSKIQIFLDTLQKYAKQSIVANYTVSAEAVTEAQVNRGQEILNEIVSYLNGNFNSSVNKIDELLMELYRTIPRKMNKVQNYILNGEPTKERAKILVSREQDALDVMRQQVAMLPKANKDSKKTTLEEVLGIKIEHCTDKEIEEIKKHMGQNASHFKSAYKICNFKTEEAFNEQIKKSFSNKKRLLWHGSRNENWLNIIKTGLLIQPTGVATTGAMMGIGLYFANKCQKSIGYTSIDGSYWASGRDTQAFLAIYKVNTGNEYEVASSTHGSTSYLKSKGDYDSLYAKAGTSLRNDEFVIYRKEQCTIKYIVEVGKA